MQNLPSIRPESIAGAVIDPVTGRLCATAADLGRALGVSNTQIEFCRAKFGTRRYQDKFHDIEDVMEARSKIGNRGRPVIKTVGGTES